MFFLVIFLGSLFFGGGRGLRSWAGVGTWSRSFFWLPATERFLSPGFSANTGSRASDRYLNPSEKHHSYTTILKSPTTRETSRHNRTIFTFCTIEGHSVPCNLVLHDLYIESRDLDILYNQRTFSCRIEGPSLSVIEGSSQPVQSRDLLILYNRGTYSSCTIEGPSHPVQ